MTDATNQGDIITVAILDDDANLRKELSWLLNNITGMRCSGAYANPGALMAGLAAQTPDVLLLDVKLNNDSGLHAIKTILSQFPSLKVIMHSNYEDQDKIVRCMHAGASGYLSKNISASLLRAAIIEVYHGGSAWPAGYEARIPLAISNAVSTKLPLFRKIVLFLRAICKRLHD